MVATLPSNFRFSLYISKLKCLERPYYTLLKATPKKILKKLSGRKPLVLCKTKLDSHSDMNKSLKLDVT